MKKRKMVAGVGKISHRMRDMRTSLFVLGLVAMLGATSCTSINPFNVPSPSNDGNYSSSDIGGYTEVVRGKIVSVRATKITPSSTAAGATIGGLAGAVGGSAIGGSRRVNALSAMGVGLGGALAGAATQKAIMTRSGVELEVRAKNGRTYAITQYGNAADFYEGQPVKIRMGSKGSIVIPE